MLIKTNKSKPLVPYDEQKHYEIPKKSRFLENKPAPCQNQKKILLLSEIFRDMFEAEAARGTAEG